MKKLLSILALLFLVAAVLVWSGWERYQRFLQTPLEIPAGGHVYLLNSGTSGTEIVAQLTEWGFTQSVWQWKLLMRLEPHLYRTGEYQLAAGMKPRDVLNHLSSGKVIQYRITLVEGWTFREFMEALAANDVLKHELDPGGTQEWAASLAKMDLAHPEGWFLPETYQFTRGDSDLDILIRSHAAMKEALNQAWASRHIDLPVKTPYELLILASIIEKETAIDDERRRIAGVFTRRLEKGMRLQTDPTVIYGMGDSFDGNIRRRDLQADTPYNTYTRHGLPPTPIAMPGKASLAAAASPQAGEELYFVADGSGGHSFSVTLEEHQAAVRKLIGKD